MNGSSSFGSLVELDEQPMEPPSQLADRGTVLPPLECPLQHLADPLPGPVRGPSDSVTPRAHQGSFWLCAPPTHHPQVPDSTRRAHLSSLQLAARHVFKSRPPRKVSLRKAGSIRPCHTDRRVMTAIARGGWS